MRTRRMVAAAAAAVALLSAGCAEEATRDAEGEIVEEGEMDVFSFAVGDCFSSPELGTADEPTEVGGVTAVPCSEPHQNEVYHLFDVEDGDFPGNEPIQDEAREGCLAEFEGYVDATFEESALDIGALWPTEGTWDDGDREVVCYVFALDGDDLEGSMEGSGV